MQKRLDRRKSRGRSRRAITAAPAYVTGGGGFGFEDEVAAYVMAAMLAGSPPFGEGVGCIERVDWQVPDARWHFDDLLITRAAPESGRVAVSCKPAGYVTSRRWPRDAVTRLWKQWTAPERPFRRDRDLLAVVMRGTPTRASKAWGDLVNQAVIGVPDRLLGRFRTGLSAIGRDLFKGLACPRALRRGIRDESVERVRLAGRVRLWSLDLQSEDSKDTPTAVEWCRTALQNGNRSTARRLHGELLSLAARRREQGGTVARLDLIKELGQRYRLRGWADHEASWTTLDRRSTAIMDLILDNVGEPRHSGAFSLVRDDVMAASEQALAPGRVLMIEGESGSGKSAISKRLARRYARVLWLDASDLDEATIQDVGRRLGIDTALHELVAEHPLRHSLLVIDRAERLSPRALRVMASLVKAAVSAASPWTAMLTSHEGTSKRLTCALGQGGVDTTQTSNVSVPLPSQGVVAPMIPRVVPVVGPNPPASLVRALCNLKVLDWTSRSASTRKIGGLPDIIEAAWQGFVGEEDAAARGQVLKKLAEVDAERVVGGVPLGEVGGADEQRVAASLVVAGVLSRREERLYLRHDVMGDWARLKTLVEVGDQVGHVLIRVGPNIRWAPAIRLLAQWLAQGGSANRRRLVEMLQPGLDSRLYRLLLEGLLSGGGAPEVLFEILPRLVSSESGHLEDLLRTFTAVATAPSEEVRVIRRDHPVGAALRAAHRTPIPDLWTGVLPVLDRFSDAIAGRAPLELALVVRCWLNDPRAGQNPAQAEASRAASRLAIAAARETQARIAEQRVGRGREFAPVFEAALLAAAWLPEESATLGLEMARRREWPAWVKSRAKKEQKRVAAEIARRRRELVRAKGGSSANRGTTLVPTFRRNRPPLSDGPLHMVDEAFQRAVTESLAILPLFRQRPDIAGEILLACLLEDPSQDDARYSNGLRSDDTGTVDPHDWFPPLYLRGPWVVMLRQNPDNALRTMLRLIDVATNEWQRLRLPPPQSTDHDSALKQSSLSMTVDGQERQFLGDRGVFGWYLGQGNPGHVIQSTLMALEFWLYERVDANQPVDSAVREILARSESVAPLGVLAALARKKPELLRGCLISLLSSWRLVSWDDIFTAHAKVPIPDIFKLPGMNRWFDDEAERWSKLPHRTKRLSAHAALEIVSNDSPVRAAMEKTRALWRRELDAGESADREELERLLAMLDPANLRLTGAGPDSVALKVAWPPPLRDKYAEQSRASSLNLLALHLPEWARTRLDAGKALNDQVASELWDSVHSLPLADGEERAGPRKSRLIAARVAAACALETLAPSWLDAHPERRVWCERAVVDAMNSAPSDNASSPVSLYERHIEAFAGEWAIARLAAGDRRPEPLRVLAEAMMSTEHIVTGQIVAAAVRKADPLGGFLGRVMNMMWMWAALSCMRPDWSERREHARRVTDGWRRRLLAAFASGKIPESSIPWKSLRLRAAHSVHRHDQRCIARARADFGTAGVSTSGRSAGSPGRTLDWSEYRHHGFNWSILEHVIQRVPVDLGSASVISAPALVELDRRVTDLLLHAMRHGNRRSGTESYIPNMFERFGLARACRIIAGHTDDRTAMRLWKKLSAWFPDREHWAEAFFERWFDRPPSEPKQAERYHRRWKEMIRVTSSNPKWKAWGQSRDLAEAWSALLGVNGQGKGISDASHAPSVKDLQLFYAEWAAKCLNARFRIRRFCAMLQQPGALPLVVPALAWIDTALKSLGPYAAREQDTISEIASVCIVAWYRHGEEVIADPEAREAILSLVRRLSELAVPAVRDLVSDIEATLGVGSSPAPQGPAVSVRYRASAPTAVTSTNTRGRRATSRAGRRE